MREFKYLLFSLIFISGLFFAPWLVSRVSAEVATKQDWIGFFPVYTTAVGWHNSANAAYLAIPNSWVYANNNCNRNWNTATPNLSISGCSLGSMGVTFDGTGEPNNLTPGAYEFRLNINDTGTGNSSNPLTSLGSDGAMLSQSKVVWKKFWMNNNPLSCVITGSSAYVDINLYVRSSASAVGASILKGIETVNILRNTPPSGTLNSVGSSNPAAGTYRDTSVVIGQSYTYQLQAVTTRGVARPSENTASISIDTSTCLSYSSWLQTIGGDVNANNQLNLHSR